ncbi:MAG: DNA polymerase I [Parcubacteria group bacterium Gr01-1014_48]|nr:MAG: DNA polymerase I [Parcubacteria group bacterium Gr01-1014_48]
MATKKEEKSKKIVLLDVHAILHRAYHALPEFTSRAGEPTGGLYGLVSMLLKIVQELKPDYIIACYDLPEATFRHEAYEGYKATRAKTDDALIAQIIRSRDVFEACNIPAYDKAGFEADDILATIAEQAKKNKNLRIVIASGDMDTLQLVDDDRVTVYTLKKGINDTILYNEKAVEERFGFKPALLTDYKGLRGDPSDNIIGIAGIGEKTATELLLGFGTIENIYKVLKKDRNKLLEAGIKERIVKLLEEGEEEALFSKMLATAKRDVPIEFELPKKEWRADVDVNKILALFHELQFKTLGARVKQLLGIETEEPNFSQPSFHEAEKEMASGEDVAKLSIAVWLLDSNLINPDLDEILSFAKCETFDTAKEKILKEIEEKNLRKVYEEIELPLIPIVKKMQERGVKIDVAYLKKLSKEYHKKLDALEGEIWRSAGREFNINSPRQLGEVLFSDLHLTAKNMKKTSTGAQSTRESELEKLQGEHPIIEHILEYRGFQKLLSTYIDNIPHMVESDGRLHATFLQAGTTTGRMSSNNPNLQNIPIKTELGNNIRKAFIAEKGFVLAAFDYSQIELRVAAFLSGDPKLIKIFVDGGDVHTAVAAQVFGVSSEKVDKEMRRRAKVINFGILYGMGVNALRQNLGTNRADAEAFFNEYFKTFSVLGEYLEQVKKEARKNGYTTTYFGRRRNFEGLSSHIQYIKAMAERMAMNAPLQGTQSDIIKIAMARIDAYIQKEKLEKDIYLLLQVHDELVYEIKSEQTEKVAPAIKKIMETVLSPKETEGVPIVTGVSVGENWGEMEGYN